MEMLSEDSAIRRRLAIGYTVSLFAIQCGIPFVYISILGHFVGSLSMWNALWMFFAGSATIGIFFSVYLPFRYFKADTSYPIKVTLFTVTGVFFHYCIILIQTNSLDSAGLHDSIKLALMGISAGSLQALWNYLYTLKSLAPHFKTKSTVGGSLFNKNLFFIVSIVIFGASMLAGDLIDELDTLVRSAPELKNVLINNVDSLTTHLLLILSITTAIIVFLTVRFTRLKTQPLKDLACSADALARGQISKVNIVTGDEVEELADKFNLMVEKVKDREDDLIIRGQHLALLYALAESLNQNKNTSELFDMTMDWFDTVFGFEVGTLRLYSPSGLRLIASKGFDEQAADRMSSIKLSDSLSGMGIVKNTVVLVTEIDTLRGTQLARAIEMDLKSFISIPLYFKDSVTGAMLVGSRHKKMAQVDTGNIEMLAFVGNLLGIAIERSSEFDRIEEEKFHWESAVHSIQDVISVHDNHWRIKKVNPAFLEFFGVSEAEAVGRYCYEFFHSSDSPHPDCPLVASSMTRIKCNATMESEGRQLSISVHPTFKHHGVMDGCIHIARDVTEINRLREHAHQADKLGAIGRLAAGIAHNVNNPLTYSLNYLFILKESAEDEKTKEYLAKVEHGIHRSKEVLGRLLELSRPTNDPLMEINIADPIADTVKFFSEEAKKSKIIIDTEHVGDLTVVASKKSLEEVFLNLFANAVDAGATELRVETIKNVENVVVTVADNGEGIEKDDIARLFEPYFTTKPKGKGTGLGLYVSYKIIKSMQGDIWCVSQKGDGTKFFISLPAVYPAQ